MLPRYVARVFIEWFWDGSSFPCYDWYHFCFYIITVAIIIIIIIIIRLVNLDEFSAFSKAQLNGTLTSIGAGEKALQAVLQSGEKLHDVQGNVKMTPQFPVMVICIFWFVNPVVNERMWKSISESFVHIKNVFVCLYEFYVTSECQ